ncbi:DCL family protein [Corynebacterium heidelbergense]|uniref:DUF3223 domain-containing protein n=1 Tax=Corynebacterium heidelbergense TaxID=2055947 RepID=A0A364VDU1_9CORY|nr:DUF3223 domain-containing protein [Corynebacterium heidelbergense]WCZ37030.1 hypothetical protein CHEID_07485 [Corynebacterium heidelbergense]
MPYTLGGLSFNTKKEVCAHASAVLNRAALDKFLHGPDARFACDLLAHHPDASRKRGVGVIGITVVHIADWGTRNFRVVRRDGSVDNWSIKKCISHLRPDDHPEGCHGSQSGAVGG